MSRTRRILTLTLTFLGVVFIVLFLIFLKHLTGPSKASNIVVESTPSTFNLNPVQVTNHYVDFSYPQQMSPLQIPLQGSQVATFNFMYKDVETWRLGIAVTHVMQPLLSDDSSYSFRKDNPQTYQEDTEKYGDNTFYVMTDTSMGGFSKVAYTLNGYETADISLYGDDPNGDSGLQSTFQEVLKSWKWNN